MLKSDVVIIVDAPDIVRHTMLPVLASSENGLR